MKTVEQILATVGAERGDTTVTKHYGGCDHIRANIQIEGWTETGLMTLDVAPKHGERPASVKVGWWEPEHNQTMYGDRALAVWAENVGRLTKPGRDITCETCRQCEAP